MMIDIIRNVGYPGYEYLERMRMMKRDKLACTCKNISYGMIEDAVKNGARTYEDVQDLLRFGTGCGKCREFIRYLIRDINEEIDS